MLCVTGSLLDNLVPVTKFGLTDRESLTLKLFQAASEGKTSICWAPTNPYELSEWQNWLIDHGLTANFTFSKGKNRIVLLISWEKQLTNAENGV